MIIVKLKGGLGNQMFQYAMGKALSIKLDTNLKLDLSFLLDRSSDANHTFRDYELNIFDINIDFVSYQEKHKYICSYSNNPKLAIWKLQNKVLGCKFFQEQENGFATFDPSVFDLKDNIYLDGFWQSPKYFNHIKDIILKEFTFKEALSEDLKLLADEIQNCNSICLNVRRGDYISRPDTNKFHGVKGLDYFDAGISHITNAFQDVRIYVFSDDISWCIENIKYNFPVRFVEDEYPNKKVKEYLRLMNLCKHFVISNSSFSWWAAWLNQNPNKIVIAPKLWFNDPAINTSDLIPDNWIRI